jgi:hypothetical protein
MNSSSIGVNVVSTKFGFSSSWSAVSFSVSFVSLSDRCMAIAVNSVVLELTVPVMNIALEHELWLNRSCRVLGRSLRIVLSIGDRQCEIGAGVGVLNESCLFDTDYKCGRIP